MIFNLILENLTVKIVIPRGDVGVLSKAGSMASQNPDHVNYQQKTSYENPDLEPIFLIYALYTL